MRNKNKSKGCRNVQNKARYSKLSDFLIIPDLYPAECFWKISKYLLYAQKG